MQEPRVIEANLMALQGDWTLANQVALDAASTTVPHYPDGVVIKGARLRAGVYPAGGAGRGPLLGLLWVRNRGGAILTDPDGIVIDVN